MSISCEHCVGGNIIPGEPKGTMLPDGSAYIAEGVDKTRAIIFLTDIFGLPLVNCKIMADRLADEVGCDVWVPDLFEGSPPVAVEEMERFLPDIPGQKLSWAAIFSLVWLALRKFPKILGNTSAKADARAEPIIKKIKDEKKYEKIGVVGYCYGGGIAGRLAGKGLYSSAVIVHPSAIGEAFIQAINIPTLWLCAEEDRAFNTAAREKAEALLAARKGKENFVEYEFHVYEGTCHGFAARPNLSIPSVKEGYEKSFGETVKWFKKTLW